jgi:hypothetical protein
MRLSEDMRHCAAAKRNHCEQLLDAHNPAEAAKWRASAAELDRWSHSVAKQESRYEAIIEELRDETR